MSLISEVPRARSRKFLPLDFKVSNWKNLQPYFDELLNSPLDTLEEVEDWLVKSSELLFALVEDKAWRFIRMTCDTENKGLKEHFQLFVRDILPQMSIYDNKLKNKLFLGKAFDLLDRQEYEVLIRSVKNEIELFREENVSIKSEMSQRARDFDEIAGSFFIEESGEKLTMQMAASLLEGQDAVKRARVWGKITSARLARRDDLDQLYTDLIGFRNEIAQNAGFSDFGKYKFKALGRFDYSLEDCRVFHDAIEKVVTPVLLRQSKKRRQRLNLDVLRPWDLAVNEFGEDKLHPFQDTNELIALVVRIFNRLDPRLGQKIEAMKAMNHFDLGSRLGKAPGGYNYSLPETGVPFIFMNAVGTQSDITTMLHEGGHAVHSFACSHLNISYFTWLPSEVAELASMSMELICLDFFDEIYDDPKKRLRAIREQLIRPLTVLPWIASIDAFQFWVYAHPEHSHAERSEAWKEIYTRFHGDYVSWQGHEEVLETLWQKQGHVFDVPFYYIEYAIAQLGAIAVWRNYRENPVKGLQSYLDALTLGYSRPIPEVYATAGVRFDFSEPYIRELIDFLLEELDKVEAGLGIS